MPSSGSASGCSWEPSQWAALGGGHRHRQTWFLAIFVKVGLGLVAFATRSWLVLVFFAAYGLYFVPEMRDDARAHTDADLEPLKLQPGRSNPLGLAVLVQTLVTMAAIIYLL
jgi:hypothetical protein